MAERGSISKGFAEGSAVALLEYREPYRFAELLGFFESRALAGIEAVGDGFYGRTARIALPDGTQAAGWLHVSDDGRGCLVVGASDALAAALPQVALRIRRQFDLDSDPHAVAKGLAPMADAVPGTPVLGTRVPGCFDPFETACRAVLGQQVTVKAANMIAGRVAKAYGTPIETGVEGLDRIWPSPAEVLAIPDLESAFGRLGVVKSRSRAIAEVARLIEEGALCLEPGADFDEQMQALLAVKGIGPWTANYVAMRTMGHPDAFLESDAGVAHALPGLSPKERAALAEQWRPWRSYAVLNLWNSLDG